MTTTTDAVSDLDRSQFFIGGEWVEPQGSDAHISLEAATEQPLGRVALGSEADIDAAVRAARTALDDGPWGRASAAERAEVMLRFADALNARADDTVKLASRENGMPLALSEGYNGAAPGALLQIYAGMVQEVAPEEVQPSQMGSTFVRREAVGVVGAITAWNYPMILAMLKIAPAMAAGCTVVLKPSPEASLNTFVIADAALEAGVPAGVVNLVPADRDAGASLVTHPLVDKIAFTGSTAAGRVIGAECGRLIRRCTLELGGKSASIVLDDADLDMFVAGLGLSAFMNNGQTCVSQSRVLAPRSRYDEVVDAIAQYAREQNVGNPLDPEVSIGPMASATQQERVLGYIDIGKSSGARLVTGGGQPAGQDRGFFVEPTVFADVDNSSRIAREEIFGPVVTVIPYEGEDEAVRIANDTNYGLGGSVWTTDEARGLDVARRVRTGTIGINYYVVDLMAPYGGMKDSGLGRELGRQGLESYFEYKAMYGSADLLADQPDRA